MSALVDARGCLTPAGMAALQSAPVGQAPAELAQHVATCPRCQARLLAASAGRPPGAPPRRDALGAAGRLWRSVAFMVAALVLALLALVVIGWLQRPGGL
ncbi:MAG TPA: hypothetical protein VMT87_10255 [Vicinamibacteria bacterium]|nr:hypothetical protein [Vicinamibacteria bacterium]